MIEKMFNEFSNPKDNLKKIELKKPQIRMY